MEAIVCMFAAPIPVGHRVECTWFFGPMQDLHLRPKSFNWDYEPMIKDLVTGIEYSSHRAFEHSGRMLAREPLAIGAHANPHIRTTRHLRGLVRRCRVVTCTGYTGDPIQTHLDIEPVPPPKAWGT